MAKYQMLAGAISESEFLFSDVGFFDCIGTLEGNFADGLVFQIAGADGDFSSASALESMLVLENFPGIVFPNE